MAGRRKISKNARPTKRGGDTHKQMAKVMYPITKPNGNVAIKEKWVEEDQVEEFYANLRDDS